jgi:hypothetical protein
VCAGNPGYTKYATKVAQQPKVLCTDPPRVALDSFYWQG